MSEQTNMQILSTWQPIVVLEKLEEELPEWREIVVSAMCLCADKRIISSSSEDLYGRKNKMFSRKLLLHFISCGLIFYGCLIYIGFNVLRAFCNFRMFISCMLVIICHVREIRSIY
jgi:hypothetical protein